ncbi:MAG: ZIP family metal transporter [Clostridiales bacterium]|nr:ZIP family metal transporter [Clostridiales bacterium]
MINDTVRWAFLGTCFPFAVTALGALNVFFVRHAISDTLQCLFLGFAGGVMTAASIWSLLIPGIEEAEQNGQVSWLVVSLGFLAGVLALLFLDSLFRRLEKNKSGLAGTELKQKFLSRSTRMMVLAITLHNIPEGMAVGAAFSMAAANPGNPALWTGAWILSLGIGIQNYPEGAAVSLPLLKEGLPRWKAFFLGSLSALVEPAAGVLAALLVGGVHRYMPVFLSFAAGTMIYVVVEELIPEAHLGDKENIGTLGFVVGFILMMILDVALG